MELFRVSSPLRFSSRETKVFRQPTSSLHTSLSSHPSLLTYKAKVKASGVIKELKQSLSDSATGRACSSTFLFILFLLRSSGMQCSQHGSNVEREGAHSLEGRHPRQQEPEPAPSRAAGIPAAPAALLSGIVICRRDRGKGPHGCGSLVCDAEELWRDGDNNLCVFLSACPSARIETFDGRPVRGEGGSERVACGRTGCLATIGVLDINDGSVVHLSAPKKVSVIVHNSTSNPLTKKEINRYFMHRAPSAFA